MTSLGIQIAANKGNNLNAIRLLLALAVILSHSFPVSLGLGGESKGEPLYTWTHQQESFGSVAVNLFFLISGMLITASWLRSASMQDFLMKRVLRIYPGFIVAVGFSGILVWMLCPEFRADVGHGISWSYLMLKDWIFLTDTSLNWPGTFAKNPLSNAANGSLWTIQKEFLCYLLVAIIGLFCLFKHRWAILLAAIIGLFAYSMSLWSSTDTSRLDCRFLAYYLVGMNFWLWRDRIVFSKWLALISFAGLLVVSQFKPWFAVLFPIMGGYFTLWFGYGPRLDFFAWTDKTDLSYGTYLYAFLVQQIVAMNESFRHPWLNFIISAPAALLLAWLSWNLVEKKFLAKKKMSHGDYDPGAVSFSH